MTFQELGLKKELLSAVTKIGFVNPTPIQEQAIPYLLEQQGDLVGLASTGTGKTAAFGLPMLNQIDLDEQYTQGLVLCPTRELCIQITNDLINFSENLDGVNIVPVYGGTDIVKQIRQVERGAHIIVATPGRLIDLIERKKVKLHGINVVVLDEADEMLNMGFKDELDQILAFTPKEKKTWLFSATMPKAVRDIAQNYMTDPHELTLGERNAGNANIEHQYAIVKEKDKYLALKRVLDFHPDIFGLVFCRTKMDTQEVADNLVRDGYNAGALHGDLNQAQRDRMMAKFRQRHIRILVATDVAARGIDVSDITHVLHYNLPDEAAFYTHRSGRTARADKKGISIALLGPREASRVPQLERMVRAPFKRIQIPKGDEVCRVQLLALVGRAKEVKYDEKEMADFMPEVYHAFEGLSREEIIQRFAALEFNRFLEYYRNAPDLNPADRSTSTKSTMGGMRERERRGDSPERERSERRETPASGYQRFFISLGERDRLDKGRFLRLLCDVGRLNKNDIGSIEMSDTFSFFELNAEKAEDAVARLNRLVYENRPVRANAADSKRDGGPKKKDKKNGFSKRKKEYDSSKVF